MMDKLPFEVILQILDYVPLSSFQSLYAVFPQVRVDEALVYKLRNNKTKPLLNLVSTNLHELAANTTNKRNESFLSFYFASYDPIHRFIWTLPDFSSSNHYFRVKDAYVSHGKLVIRPYDNNNQTLLASLWDIRKSFPPTRAGSFSGASEYVHVQSREFTLHQSGCILDSCLIPYHMEKQQIEYKRQENTVLKRPHLPPNYIRQIPFTNPSFMPTYPDPICGFFFVERLAISIPTFLDLFCCK
ncbi:uncharacterized protein B0P05DRAFT_586988 [Gilbertella persicaria]|uniref:uncharacterized protein n=1 Tax=Gilbertella persicaria TaxID=101096 RepID=UPI00221F9823|nr:uncharacterized protein B0P05DRAFT_586988 [Gilbertella persicaria]KAI8079529.1 hypothetical protein B0P05DRAFT_586988 [Gilbertella persicaria]